MPRLIILTFLAISAILLICFRFSSPMLRRRRHAEFLRAVAEFRIRREQLEAKFMTLASSLGKPRGLRWLECDWLTAVAYGRDKQTGLLTAFVSVNIHFEAIEGGDMEDVAAVDTVRDASAVFHYQNGRWGTGGRALFNMSPEDALVRLANQYQSLDARASSPPVA
jgi:hypothetical protein